MIDSHAVPDTGGTHGAIAHTVPVGETSLTFYERTGDPTAPPVLLLHPWFGCHQMWHPFGDRTDRTTLAVDWYSLSRSHWSPWAAPEPMAEAAIAALDAGGHQRADVVGNSVGGIVAQVLAARHQHRVRRLVLVGTGASLGGPPTAFGALVGAWLEEPARRHELTVQLVQSLVARPLDPDQLSAYVAAVEEADPAFVGAVLGSARDLDLRPLLPGIAAPTLVIRGEHDTARTRDHVRQLLDGIPDSTAVEMAECGHSPMIEDPDRFAGLVAAHLA